MNVGVKILSQCTQADPLFASAHQEKPSVMQLPWLSQASLLLHREKIFITQCPHGASLEGTGEVNTIPSLFSHVPSYIFSCVLLLVLGSQLCHSLRASPAHPAQVRNINTERVARLRSYSSRFTKGKRKINSQLLETPVCIYGESLWHFSA